MGIFGGASAPDYAHGNNGATSQNSGTRHGNSKTIRNWGGGSDGGHVQDGGTHGGGATAG
jgi:hypothetical protein